MDDLIQKYIDRVSFASDTEFAKAQLAELLAAYTKVKEARANLGPATGTANTVNAAKESIAAVRQMTEAVTQQNQIIGKSTQTRNAYNLSLQQNVKNLNDYKKALKDNSAFQKQALKDVESGKISADEYRAKITQLTEAQFKYKQEISSTSAAIKAQTQIQSAAPTSIVQAQAQNKILTIQRNALPDSDIEGIKALNDQIDRNNELIDKNSDLLAKQKINIGNYPINAFSSSFKTLNTELESVKDKLASGTFKGKELDELTGKMAVLTNATALTGQQFATVGQQQKAYSEAATQIGLVYGKDSKVFKEFSAGVNEGSKSIKEISSDVAGATTKSKGFGSALGTVYGGLRKLANILPNFGISTAILLLATAFGNAIQAATKFFNKLIEGKIAVQTLNDVNQKSIEIYSKQTSEVSALSEVVKDNAISTQDRASALEKLIALNPDYLRGLTLENINTDEGRQILDKYNTALEKKAELQAAGVVNANANQAVANLHAERDALIELSKAGKVNFNDLSETQQKYLGNFNTFTANFKFTASLLNTAISKKDISTIIKGIDTEIKTESSKVSASLKIYKDKFKENLTSEGDSVKGIIEDLQQKIATLQKIQPTLLNEADIKNNVAQIKKYQDEIDRLLGKTKPKTDNSEKELEDSLKRAQAFRDTAASEIAKMNEKEVQNEKDKYKTIAEDQKKSFEERTLAIIAFDEAGKRLLELQKTDNESALNAEIEKDKKAAKSKQELAAIEEVRVAKQSAIIKNYADDTAKFQIEVAGLFRASAEDDYKKIEEAAAKAYEKIKKAAEQSFSDQKDQIEIDKNDKLLQLNKDYNDGRLNNLEEYNTKSQQIEEAAARRQKELELDRLKVSEAVFEMQSNGLLKNYGFLKQISDLEVELAKAKTEKLIELEKELTDKKKEAQSQAFITLSAFIEGGFDKQKNAIQDQIDLNEKKTQRDIELINSSAASEQEKADKIAIIQARADAQKTQLERKQKAADIQKAQFDKQMAILRIGISTAQAVAEISAKAAALFPFGAPLLAQIPFVIATGALQVAAIIAQPIPRFKSGKKAGEYQGWGIVDDGGKTEPIYRAATGQIEMSAGQPKDRLTFLNKDDIVFPELFPDLQRDLIRMSMPKMKSLPTIKNDNNNLYAELKKANTNLTKIANKRELHLGASRGGMEALWKWGSIQTRYVDENCNW